MGGYSINEDAVRAAEERARAAEERARMAEIRAAEERARIAEERVNAKIETDLRLAEERARRAEAAPQQTGMNADMVTMLFAAMRGMGMVAPTYPQQYPQQQMLQPPMQIPPIVISNPPPAEQPAVPPQALPGAITTTTTTTTVDASGRSDDKLSVTGNVETIPEAEGLFNRRGRKNGSYDPDNFYNFFDEQEKK